jgi:hypothetical protein
MQFPLKKGFPLRAENFVGNTAPQGAVLPISACKNSRGAWMQTNCTFAFSLKAIFSTWPAGLNVSVLFISAL